MKRTLALLFIAFAFAFNGQAQTVKLTDAKDKKQVDVTVDGQPFTSYVYWDNQKKPILYPLRTAIATRCLFS